MFALQETKLPDHDFPHQAFQEAGYHAIASGQKAYNGVAFLSRKSMRDVVTDFPEFDDHARRVLAATVGDVRILNIYVPNGEHVHSEKYQYKLNWLKKLDIFLKTELKHHAKMIVLGDFNIAPASVDVYDPKFLEGQVLFSEPERKAFHDMIALGFTDCFRLHHPAEKMYSWWDYRMNAFKRNMGLRIDHILANTKWASDCKHCVIDKKPRSFDRPSDHAPVVAEF